MSHVSFLYHLIHTLIHAHSFMHTHTHTLVLTHTRTRAHTHAIKLIHVHIHTQTHTTNITHMHIHTYACKHKHKTVFLCIINYHTNTSLKFSLDILFKHHDYYKACLIKHMHLYGYPNKR